jgi:hypothetical protein
VWVLRSAHEGFRSAFGVIESPYWLRVATNLLIAGAGRRLTMTEICSVCDTLWRLYLRALDNLKELAEKHGESRSKGDRNSVEILGYEIMIAEASLRSVQIAIRHHETAQHPSDKQQNARSQAPGAPNPKTGRSETGSVGG